MGFIIDNIGSRISAGNVEIKKNGDGFLLVAKRYCPLTGDALEEEYETLTIAAVEQQKEQHVAAIATLDNQKKNLLLQIEQIDANTVAAQKVLPDFDDLVAILKDFGSKVVKEKK